MEPQLVDPWLVTFELSLFVASIGTWAYLLAVKARRGQILPYEPRQPVPWGPLGAMLAVVFMVLAISSGLAAAARPIVPHEIPEPLESAQGLVGLIAFQAVLSGAVVLVVVVVSGANLRDLGLPAYADELARDVGIGIAACLAALVPVFGLQLVLTSLVGGPDEVERNPLIETVLRDRHFGVTLLASVAAVVMAPLSEEIVFRLLLQGWLEKWEDRLLGWRRPVLPDDVASAVTVRDAGEPTIDERLGGSAAESEAVATSPGLSDLPPPEPPERGLFGLPFGWTPIVVSSVVFALAHFGYGPDPVPLFVFAMILGYVYQRTHRIVPGIVAHGMFNMVTMLMLWRMLMSGMEME